MARHYVGTVIGTQEGERFAPDFDDTLRLRLTRSGRAMAAPYSEEIDLTTLLAEVIEFDAEAHDGNWVYGVEEPVRPHRLTRDRA